MRVLVMGLPGSGKTTFCRDWLLPSLPPFARYHNADEVRAEANDWDFTREGRLRQAQRMVDRCEPQGIDVIDMVAGTREQREIIKADYTFFIDRIKESKYPDTNAVFERPEKSKGECNVCLTEFDLPLLDRYGVSEFVQAIISKLPHGLMIGRFQPWHAGHRALFEKILEKHGLVVIAVRDTWNTSEKDPYHFSIVEQKINEDLDKSFKGLYSVIKIPNIHGVYYGRDVGYAVEKIDLPPDIESISASSIRRSL